MGNSRRGVVDLPQSPESPGRWWLVSPSASAEIGKPRRAEPVGAFPTAESAYGMGDACGGVWDWTSSWEDERRSSRVLRGGAWAFRPGDLRCAVRHSYLPRVRSASVGMRCARSI